MPGLRISIGGNITISNDLGGFIAIEYQTANLREGEAFLIFLDQYNIHTRKHSNDTDENGYSKASDHTFKYFLPAGMHMI